MIPNSEPSAGVHRRRLFDLATFGQLIPVVTNAAGSWGLTVAMPSNPTLVGIQAALQIALFGTSGPFGFDLSNGLIVTVGY